MRVYSIQPKITNNQRTIGNANRSSDPILRQNMPNDSVSFGSTLDDEAERRARSKKDQKGMSGIRYHVFGGREQLLAEAKLEIDKEVSDLKTQNAVSAALIESNNKLLGVMQGAQSETNAANVRASAAFAEAQQSKNETIIQQGKVIEATQQLADERKKLAVKFEQLLEEQKKATAEKEAKDKELLEKMEDALKKKDTDMLAQLKSQKIEMKEFYEKQMEIITSKMTTISNTEAILREIADTKNKNGFGKIAGYNQEKEILTNMVGNAIGVERSGKPADVPNGVLFFGPKGNGKSTFAEAFAGQIKCRLVKIEDTLDPVENLKKLREAARVAQENFEKDKIRTILHIDEFEDFAPKGSKITGALKSFMDKCSKDHHCTVFATTNYPENIDDILLRDKRFDVKVGLESANKQNATEILKHYGEKFADESVNFVKLAEEIVKPQPEIAFSNARIESVVTRYKKEHTNMLKMSHKDFMASINELGPDISKKAMEIFKGQIKYMKSI